MSREKDLPLAPLAPRPRPLTSGSWPVGVAEVVCDGANVAVGAAAGVAAVVPGCGAGTVAVSSTGASSPAPLETSSLAASFWFRSLASSSSSSNSLTLAALSSSLGRFVLI